MTDNSFTTTADRGAKWREAARYLTLAGYVLTVPITLGFCWRIFTEVAAGRETSAAWLGLILLAIAAVIQRLARPRRFTAEREWETGKLIVTSTSARDAERHADRMADIMRRTFAPAPDPQPAAAGPVGGPAPGAAASLD